jgi:CheY-like chemotaxis protein
MLHGGTISCESTGKGSTFSFTVPFDIVPLKNQSELFVEASGDFPHNTYDYSTVALDNELNVLVVDDSASNRKMISMLLTRCKIDHHLAENGRACIDMISHNPERFRLVLMDNLMPLMDGVTATKTLRAMNYPFLIIGITGNVMDDDLCAFLEAGADVVLLKPVKLTSLETLINFIKVNGPYSHRGMRLRATKKSYEWVPWNV